MSDTPLLETALADAHRAAGGKLVDFGGWAMPLNYGSQIEAVSYTHLTLPTIYSV